MQSSALLDGRRFKPGSHAIGVQRRRYPAGSGRGVLDVELSQDDHRTDRGVVPASRRVLPAGHFPDSGQAPGAGFTSRPASVSEDRRSEFARKRLGTAWQSE